jgi:hypothetical protein
MSIFASWIVTIAFFFVAFLIGKLLQYKERQEKITRRATEAIRQDIMNQSMHSYYRAKADREPYVFGTIYGNPTQYEKHTPTR